MNGHSCYTSPYSTSSTSDYTRVIRHMMYDEPVVLAGVRLLQAHCMRNGFDVRWASNSPPTPSFAKHLHRYYEPFCWDAIAAALAVGFVPYRIREDGSHLIPEVLPFGSYTWSVMRSDQMMRQSDTSRKRKSGPLLEYVISTSICPAADVRVWAYNSPDASLSCTSALASLITGYNRLLQKRLATENAELWNSRPNIVFEEMSKDFINSATERGGVVGNRINAEVVAKTSAQEYAGRLPLTQKIHDDMRRAGNLPEESSLLFAPRNFTARCLDKVDMPKELLLHEMTFARNVGMALGLPASIMLQGGSACGGRSTGTGSQWSESAASVERSILDACYPLVFMLEDLMASIYKEVYNSNNIPTFKLHPTPTVPIEILQPLYDSRLLPDEVMSRIMLANFGSRLGSDAGAATQDRHKAANILPFKDKKTD